jgi:cell wall assembly regulator SMI1
MKFQKTNAPPVTESNILNFEQTIRFGLPLDYRQFLLEHNGGVPEQDLFSIPDCNSEGLIDHFLGLGREKEDLEDWMNELEGDLPEGFIPIGFDPGGNAILMDLSDATIYYWDSARHYPQSTDDDNTFWIANSFSDLLKSSKDSDASKQ